MALDLTVIRQKLAERRLKVVAERTGLSYRTVRRVASGGNPSAETWQSLSDYLRDDVITDVLVGNAGSMV